MAGQLLNHLLAFIGNWEAGQLREFPNADDPDDLGDAMTQDDIDFVKRLRKEMDRFGTCTDEKTGVDVSITDPDAFTIIWDDDGSKQATISYRVNGDSDWLPLFGTVATNGFLVSPDQLDYDTTYNFRVQAICANGIATEGQVITATTSSISF